VQAGQDHLPRGSVVVVLRSLAASWWSGWRKPGFFLNPAQRVFFFFFFFFLGFFLFFFIFAQKSEFLGFFQFQEYFKVHPDIEL
jgi:hypothetical protein